MDSRQYIQGWQSLPAELLDCVATRLTQQDHKATNLVCKHWNQVIRQCTYKAAVSDGSSIKALLQSFPHLKELHLNGIQAAIPEQAVHAVLRHTSLRSLHLNSVRPQPALAEALAAAGKPQELYVSDMQPPEPHLLPRAQVQLTCWSGLRKLHLKETRSPDVLNAYFSSLATIPQLTELSVTYRSKAGQQAHDPAAQAANLAQLPIMPDLKKLSLDNVGVIRDRRLLPQMTLTSLALVHELQLPYGFFADLTAQTALCALELSSCTGPQLALFTNADFAAVLPYLRHLTYLSLAGCSELHMSCLGSLNPACTGLQHLNIASMQRSGGVLVLPDRLTHLDISCDHEDAATAYILPPGLRYVNISNTVLGDQFCSYLRTSCPHLRSLDTRGCKMLTSLDGIHQLVQCCHLEEVILDTSHAWCTPIAYSMLRRGRLCLAADLGSEEAWSLESRDNDAVVLRKQASMMMRDRRIVCIALLVWGFQHMVVGLAFAPVMSFWLGLVIDLVPYKGSLLTCCVMLVPYMLLYFEVIAIMQLGRIMRGAALKPGTTRPWLRRIAEACGTSRWMRTNLFVGRWLVSPACKRIRNKPTAIRIIAVVAAMYCAQWVMQCQVWHMVQLFEKAMPKFPPLAVGPAMQPCLIYPVYMSLMSPCWVGWVCSLVALLG